MRARVSWTLVFAAFLALPPFQRDRVEEMGFEEIFRIERMRVDLALTQALRSRWDTEANAFVFPWGHMIPSLEDVSRITGLRVYGRAVSGYTYPCYHDLAERLLDLPMERRSSLVPRVALQESLGLFEAGKNAGESEDEYLERLARVSRRELASEPGPQADLDLRRFLVLFLGRLLFATRGDAVHCRFLPLLADLGEIWAYLHLPALGRGELTRPGLVPFARRWGARRDTRHLADQLERLQEAIDSYPYLDVVWQPYLGEGDEGQPWLVQARPYFGRSVWLHALNLVLPLNLFLTQRSLGFRQSVVEFPELERLRAELRLQESLAQRLQQIVTDIGRSRSRSRSAASASRATGGTVGQYLASSSSRRRNKAEERRRQDEGVPRAREVVVRWCRHLTDRRDPGSVAVESEETCEPPPLIYNCPSLLETSNTWFIPLQVYRLAFPLPLDLVRDRERIDLLFP
ncbi:hypothetical protein Taro_049475 [Colocasia esculenta]|uniref:Aminotransferase-like plant mobile domain-containing protein n=1 Tax=Colocasia esculenta TaxID=4460 RepID=A0A843XAZ8_COLES|nr:hypothetical protein [Colocasia esculenta]